MVTYVWDPIWSIIIQLLRSQNRFNSVLSKPTQTIDKTQNTIQLLFTQILPKFIVKFPKGIKDNSVTITIHRH